MYQTINYSYRCRAMYSSYPSFPSGLYLFIHRLHLVRIDKGVWCRVWHNPKLRHLQTLHTITTSLIIRNGSTLTKWDWVKRLCFTVNLHISHSTKEWIGRDFTLTGLVTVTVSIVVVCAMMLMGCYGNGILEKENKMRTIKHKWNSWKNSVNRFIIPVFCFIV